jgi:long-chain fatty acid transport protein
MYKSMIRLLAGLLVVVGVADVCGASGYAIYEWGARGNGMGGAVIGRADDPSAVVSNPAGITQLPGERFQTGATVVMPTADVNLNGAGGKAGRAEHNIWTMPSLYYTRQMSDNYWFGFAMYSRVGLGTDYQDQDNWAGRYNCSYAGIKEVSFNPNLAMKLTDELSVAVGAELAYLQFEYNMYTPTPDGDIRQEIDADGLGYGINLAVHYKPADWVAFGAAWRSEIQLTVYGDADFSAKGPFALSKYDVKDQGLDGTEPLPESLALGVVFYPFEKFSIEVDGIWTKWSAYKELVINYDDGSKATSTKNWHNTWRFQVGAEYNLTPNFDLRCGYVYDQSPINDEYEDYAVPGNDRQIVTLGAGYHRGNWTVDGSYGYLWMKDRHYEARPDDHILDSDMENGQAHMVGLSVGYRF